MAKLKRLLAGLLLPVILVTCQNADETNEIYTRIQRCLNVSRSELEDCIVREIKDAKHILIKGVDMWNVPPMDPFELEDITYKDGLTNANLAALFTNINVTGASDFEVNKLSVDYPNQKANFSVEVPRLKATGIYAVNASFGSIKFRGTGNFLLVLDDVVADTRVFVKVKDVRGEPHAQIEFDTLSFDIGKIRVRVKDIFDGDPLLVEFVNTFINENVRELFSYGYPRIAAEVRKRALAIGNGIMGAMPLNKIPGNQYLIDNPNLKNTES